MKLTPHSRTTILLFLPAMILMFIGCISRLLPSLFHRTSLTTLQIVRQNLASADTIRVEMETYDCLGSDNDPTDFRCYSNKQFVTGLSPNSILPLVQNLQLVQEVPTETGTAYMPVLYFEFFKGGEELGEIQIGYAEHKADTYYSKDKYLFKGLRLYRGLHQTSLLEFRKLVFNCPALIRALKEQGVPAKRLDPDYKAPYK